MAGIAGRLLNKFRTSAVVSETAVELMDMVEKLEIAQKRISARAYASFLAVDAA